MRGLFGFPIGFSDDFLEFVADFFAEKVLHRLIVGEFYRVLLFERALLFSFGHSGDLRC